MGTNDKLQIPRIKRDIKGYSALLQTLNVILEEDKQLTNKEISVFAEFLSLNDFDYNRFGRKARAKVVDVFAKRDEIMTVQYASFYLNRLCKKGLLIKGEDGYNLPKFLQILVDHRGTKKYPKVIFEYMINLQ